MIEKDPASFPLVTYAWVVGLAILGGVVNFLRKVKEGHARVFNVMEFIGELITAAFAGIITFYLCSAANIDPLYTAALVAITGHMGSRSIFLFEDYLTKKFKV